MSGPAPLPGALLVQADQRYETRGLRDRRASEVARLLTAAHRWRPVTGDRDGCCHLLEAVLNPEGGIFWGESPVRGLVSEEHELESPDGDCSEALWSAIGECGFLSTSEGCALFDGGETLPLPMPSAAARTGRPWRTATRTWRTP